MSIWNVRASLFESQPAQMGIFLSITNSSNELTKSQKLYRLTESNEVQKSKFSFKIWNWIIQEQRLSSYVCAYFDMYLLNRR